LDEPAIAGECAEHTFDVRLGDGESLRVVGVLGDERERIGRVPGTGERRR
jgi:hypothetical protein